MLQQIVVHTPLWVWVLLAFLIIRGVMSMRPGETSLVKLAIVPALFTAWSLWSISTRYGVALEAWALWLVGIAAGAGIGWLLLRRATLWVGPSTGKLWRSADFSLLPLLLITFLVKYGFEVALAVLPSLLADVGFRAAYMLLTGLFTGIFIGKYCRYVRASRRVATLRAVELTG